ncbi:MAG: chorismate synthase [Oscillospiraceae bacterium]|nr:chorismate synthase [Oscillospiraceae bacterium]
MRYIIFGESHGAGIGVVLEGVPAGLPLDMEFVEQQMRRRAPGRAAFATPRKEADQVTLLSGVWEGKTTGAPLCAVIYNTDTRSKDYSRLKQCPRPSHADFTGNVRYAGYNDYRGGGHFSGRLTAPLVFAGGVAQMLLRQKGIFVGAHIHEIGGVKDDAPLPDQWESALFAPVQEKDFPVFSDLQGEKMQEVILKAKTEQDSVGGVIAAGIFGLPAGYGGPDLRETAEGILARQMFAVPAVKGIEFGAGFGFASLRGSQANDPFYYDEKGNVRTRTNHSGGINGGITNGMPIVFRVAIRPTPSIGKPQETVNFETKTTEMLEIVGRHDPCIVPRAVPVIEAAAALAVCSILEQTQAPVTWEGVEI